MDQGFKCFRITYFCVENIGKYLFGLGVRKNSLGHKKKSTNNKRKNGQFDDMKVRLNSPALKKKVKYKLHTGFKNILRTL